MDSNKKSCHSFHNYPFCKTAHIPMEGEPFIANSTNVLMYHTLQLCRTTISFSIFVYGLIRSQAQQ